jgi:hypothetical protein
MLSDIALNVKWNVWVISGLYHCANAICPVSRFYIVWNGTKVSLQTMVPIIAR